MKNHLVCFAACLLTSLLLGCASYTIRPVSPTKLETDWKAGNAAKGYVFYQPELYFLVTPNAAKNSNPTNATGSSQDAGVSVTPIFLPNPQKPYQVTTFNFMAKSDFTFNFKDGWQLTSIADKADNTTIANTIAGELKTMLNAAALPAAMQGNGSVIQQSFLLHPEFDAKDGIIASFTVVPFPPITSGTNPTKPIPPVDLNHPSQ